MSIETSVGWQEFWRWYKQAHPEIKWLMFESMRQSRFPEWVRTLSPTPLFRVLEHAPLEVVLAHIHLLPRTEALRLAKTFPESEWPRLDHAYQTGEKS